MLNAVDRMMRGLQYLLGLMLLVLVALGIWNVISRYVFNKAILWADEISIFGMIALVWLGAIVCTWQGADIRMAIVADMLAPRARHLLNIVQQLVIAGLGLWVAWLSSGYVSRLYRFGMKSDAAQIPIWIIHASVTLGLVAISLVALLRLIRLLAGKPTDFHGDSDRLADDIGIDGT